MEWFLNLILFVLPAYFANATPVLLSSIWKKAPPMDFKIKFFDKRRFFGKGKTWFGFFSGIFVGTLVGVLIFYLGFRIYDFERQVFVSFLLSFGALVGDAFGAFIKRRFNIGSGKVLLLIDQTFFLIFAIIFTFPYKPEFLDFKGFVFLLIITFFLHVITNIIGYELKLKKAPY